MESVSTICLSVFHNFGCLCDTWDSLSLQMLSRASSSYWIQEFLMRPTGDDTAGTGITASTPVASMGVSLSLKTTLTWLFLSFWAPQYHAIFVTALAAFEKRLERDKINASTKPCIGENKCCTIFRKSTLLPPLNNLTNVSSPLIARKHINNTMSFRNADFFKNWLHMAPSPAILRARAMA